MPALIYRIAKLWGKPQGTVEKYDINEAISYPDKEELSFTNNFTGKLNLIRLKDEISVLLSDAEISINFTCPLCLKKFSQKVKIPEAEREFFYEIPDITEDEMDLFFINKKAMTIDLNEMVRQEIILHFPLIPVCSRSCKGLCAHCGIDKNRKTCSCKDENQVETYKPFGNLKKLI